VEASRASFFLPRLRERWIAAKRRDGGGNFAAPPSASLVEYSLGLPYAGATAAPVNGGGKAIAIAFVTAFWLAACSSESPDDTVLPKDATTLCGAASPLEQTDKDSLCAGLAQFHARDLPKSWTAQTPVYRVAILSPSQPSYLIRIEPQQQGAKLYVKRLEHGGLDIDQQSNIGEAETEQFLSLITANGFWTLPLTADVTDMPTDDEKNPKPCPAGVAFLVEGDTMGVYHFARAHCRPVKQLENIATGSFALAADQVPALKAELPTSVD